MDGYVDRLPFVALIDDDQHSTHLLTRELLAHGLPDVRHYGDGAAGRIELDAVLANCANNWPCLVIVDLKAHSRANVDFVSDVQATTAQKGVPVVVMVQPQERAIRDALYDAGAAAVFFRQADRDAYRREAAGIVSFWARSQRLDAVGM